MQRPYCLRSTVYDAGRNGSAPTTCKHAVAEQVLINLRGVATNTSRRIILYKSSVAKQTTRMRGRYGPAQKVLRLIPATMRHLYFSIPVKQ